MPTATFRFYEELNDFLPASRRRQPLLTACADHATVKQAIEALGVPHTEVEVILVNGESVDFSHRVDEGDRVAVYPMFEALDVGPILRLRKSPLRDPRFLADVHLGRLARYLRMLGFDCRYESSVTDRQLVRISCQEHRVLLTRDRELLMHRDLTHGIFVRGDRPRRQLLAVVDRLDLGECCKPFTRCMNCNSTLESVSRASVAEQVPPAVARCHRDFRRCSGCQRIYWRGTHYHRMMQLVEQLVADRRAVS
jgi:uncharacterized protein with PIN domain/sulfur carrier protein ThiS